MRNEIFLFECSEDYVFWVMIVKVCQYLMEICERMCQRGKDLNFLEYDKFIIKFGKIFVQFYILLCLQIFCLEIFLVYVW